MADADAAGMTCLGKLKSSWRLRSWSRSGALIRGGVVGTKLDLSNLDLWLLQAKKDASFSPDVLRGWTETFQTHIKHSRTRFECAKLFGNLFNEWLSSGASVTAGAKLNDAEVEVPHTDAEPFIEIGRKELHNQKERLDSIIFTPPIVDCTALHFTRISPPSSPTKLPMEPYNTFVRTSKSLGNIFGGRSSPLTTFDGRSLRSFPLISWTRRNATRSKNLMRTAASSIRLLVCLKCAWPVSTPRVGPRAESSLRCEGISMGTTAHSQIPTFSMHYSFSI